MKIAVCSDVHLEFGNLTLENAESADVLILSGDILVERDLDEWNEVQADNGFARSSSVRYHTFFQECSKNFPHVIYVAGNHEHYHGDFKYTLSELKRKFSYLKNVHILDKEVFKLDDVTFVGGTLWTDMNNEDPLTMYQIKSMMNDFRCVKNSNRVVHRKVPLYKRNEDDTAYELDANANKIQTGTKMKEESSTFCPEDAVQEHKQTLAYIKHIVSEAKEGEKIVVVGHHTPSHQSCHPRYQHDSLMNGGYHSKLDDYIMDHPQIKLWTNGHTHELYDYMIGDTRVVCNPRGYVGHEQIAREFQLKVVEV
jgi:predicted phosphodiesterase